MYGLRIERVNNGFTLSWVEDTEEEDVFQSEVIEDDEQDEMKSGEKLLWFVMEHFALGGSRHDKQRLHISRKRGDKYIPPEKPNEKA